MPSQIPSQDWTKRTAPLTGLEELLKQNPETDSYSPMEERIPTSLIGDYVLKRVTEEIGLEELVNVPVPTGPSILAFDGDEYFWDEVVTGFTLTLEGDTGSENLSAGGLLSVLGGDGISTSVTSTTTVTISLDAILNDINDVNITSANPKDIIFYNGTNWVNGPVTTLLNANNGIYFDGDVIKLGQNALIETTEIDTDGFDFTVNDNNTNSAYMGVIQNLPINFAENAGYLGASHASSNTNSYIAAYVAGAPFNKTSALVYTEDSVNNTSAYFSVNEDNALVVAAYDGIAPTHQSGANFNSSSARLYKTQNGITAAVIANGESTLDGTYFEIDIPASGDTIQMGILIDSTEGNNTPQSYIRSRNVDSGTALNGQKLTLINNITGEAEWRHGTVLEVTGATSVGIEVDLVVVTDPSGLGYTITIPNANTCIGKMLTLSRLTGGGTIQINPSGASEIAESATINITPSTSIIVASDGTNWVRAGRWT